VGYLVFVTSLLAVVASVQISNIKAAKCLLPFDSEPSISQSQDKATQNVLFCTDEELDLYLEVEQRLKTSEHNTMLKRKDCNMILRDKR
jgi:hypothetical protein